MVEYRFLETLADQQLGRYLFDTVWPAPSEGTQIAPNFLQALMHSGSYLSGAFIDGEIVGAAFGFPAKDGDGTFYIHSHMTAVLPSQQDKGIGVGLKLHQKEWARREGYRKIKWTFDPLVARNAWLNIAVLKAKATKYYVNFYGEMADSINAGDASDRILVEWNITESPVLALEKNTIEVEVPSDIVALRQSDIESARIWRKQVREALQPKMDTGWQIVDFKKNSSGNPKYILSEG